MQNTIRSRAGREFKDNRMNTELIETITGAERQAAQEKERAAAQAELLVKEAENKAKNVLSASAEVCKAYQDTQLRLASSQSEKNYAEELRKARAEAEETAKEALKNAEISVSGIIKRIVDCENGDR